MFDSFRTIMLALAAVALTASAAETVEVTFRIHAPGLATDEVVYLTGGAPELQDWNPAGVAMVHAGEHVWTVTVRFARTITLEYKYTLGSWEREGAGADGRPLPNFESRLEHGKTIDDAVYFWTDGIVRPEAVGQVTGELRYHRGMAGEGLLPRDVLVWLPPGYAQDTDRHYPVLYMHDGQNLFDPATSSFGIDWSVDESVDRLISEGRIGPMIVVGLNNTSDRTADYSPGARGEAYMEFLVYTVKPMIDVTYRSRPDKSNTLVGGSSMGGLISCMLGWQYPEVFGAVMCFSPAFSIEGRADWSGFFTDSGGQKREVFFYLDNGGIGLEEQLQPGIDEMLGFLEAEGYRRDEDFVFVLDPDARHSESAWAERFAGALLRSLEALHE